MSDNKRVVRVVDTRLEANSENQVTYVVEEGPAIANYTPSTAISHSNQNTVFNLNNIADRTCRDSRLVMDMTVTLTLNITSPGAGSAITADNFGLKQWPLNRGIQSVQHQINQASYTLQTARMIDSIARLNAFSADSDFYENTQPDVIDSYLNATGTNLTPIGGYTNTLQGDGVFKPRSLNYTLTGNTFSGVATQNVVVTCKLYEPLITPFNNISAKNRRGLYAITGEIINIQWVGDLTKMFALYMNPGWTLNSSSVSLGTTASLLAIYLTPPESYFAEIPPQSVYPYTDYQPFTQDVGSVAAGASVQVNTPVCTFTNVPNKILVYARLSDSAVTMATPDKYLTLTNLNVTFDNGLPQLSTCSTRQLWDISTRNSLVMPPACFQQLALNPYASSGVLYGCGSVMVIDPVMDLSPRPGVSTGSGGRYIFQGVCQFQNKTGTNFAGCTLYVVSLTNGQLERVGSEYRNYLLTLSQDVLTMTRTLPPIDHQRYIDARASNGFLSGGGIGDFLRKAAGLAKKAVDFGLKHHEQIGNAIDLGQKAYQAVQGGQTSMARSVHPKKKRDLFYE